MIRKSLFRVSCVFIVCAVFSLSGCMTLNRSQQLSYSTNIMGHGNATEKMMYKFLRERNKSLSNQKISYIVKTYIWESSYEGINHDVAFVQMCHETNFLNFGGTVVQQQNNFCGLGTTSTSERGAYFKTIKDGIRAHVQHLKAYGSKAPLNNKCVDPRFSLVKRGVAHNIYDLTGRWATDKNYGNALDQKLKQLFATKAY